MSITFLKPSLGLVHLRYFVLVLFFFFSFKLKNDVERESRSGTGRCKIKSRSKRIQLSTERGDELVLGNRKA